ncbi:MAG: phosphoribosylaminoimidazolesuccinocarboxamide synthase, partial [Terriglobales bacterium]
LTLHARGKVRDLYTLDGQLLLVASDRISAFDYVLGSGIPEKGRVLTQLSLFWFDFLKDTVKNHLISARVEDYPPAVQKYSAQLRGRPCWWRKRTWWTLNAWPADIFPVQDGRNISRPARYAASSCRRD